MLQGILEIADRATLLKALKIKVSVQCPLIQLWRWVALPRHASHLDCARESLGSQINV